MGLNEVQLISTLIGVISNLKYSDLTYKPSYEVPMNLQAYWVLGLSTLSFLTGAQIPCQGPL